MIELLKPEDSWEKQLESEKIKMIGRGLPIIWAPFSQRIYFFTIHITDSFQSSDLNNTVSSNIESLSEINTMGNNRNIVSVSTFHAVYFKHFAPINAFWKCILKSFCSSLIIVSEVCKLWVNFPPIVNYLYVKRVQKNQSTKANVWNHQPYWLVAFHNQIRCGDQQSWSALALTRIAPVAVT